jgi:hypothetical protein
VPKNLLAGVLSNQLDARLSQFVRGLKWLQVTSNFRIVIADRLTYSSPAKTINIAADLRRAFGGGTAKVRDFARLACALEPVSSAADS